MNLYRKLGSKSIVSKTDSMDMELETMIGGMLEKLNEVNSQMKAWVSSGDLDTVSHSFLWHQEILKGLTEEFHRLHSSFKAERDLVLLLDESKAVERARLNLEASVDSAGKALLREHDSLSSSTGQIDTVISQAQTTLGALVFQHYTFGTINSKLSNLASHLPTVNHILAAIKMKKSFDTIILSVVASTCTFLIFIYWLTK